WSPGTATPSLMSVHFDAGTFFDKLIEVFGNVLEQQGAPFDAKEVCNAIGLASVRSVDGTIAVDNEHLAVDADVALTANTRGLHAARKTEEYAGTKVHRLRVGVEIEYAVTDDLLLLGFGNSAGAQKSLRAVLDERAARAAGKPAAEPTAGVKERLTRLPDG